MFRRFFISAMFLSLLATVTCQAERTTPMSDSEGTTDAKTGKKKALSKGVAKTLKILSYLNYRDRNVDRPIVGPVEFEKARGKRIGQVTIKVMYPYGVDLDSPKVYHPTKFQKFANGMQFRTRTWVIRNELLFKEGDAIDPILFADSERNLWGKNIYKDIKFVLTEMPDSTVDVTVYIRDKWNWSVTSSLDYDKVTPGIQFNNILGLPQVINAGVSINYRPDNLYTVSASYNYSNINSSFVDVTLSGSYDRFQQGGSLNIVRNFYSANAQWAGHIKASVINQQYIAPTLASKPLHAPNLSNVQDFWLARAFKMPEKIYQRTPLLRLIISTRLVRTAYNTRPYLHSADRSINFVNQTYLLGSIGFARWDYYIDHNVYELGKAEYFTKGISAAFISGFQEDEELGRRTYVGISLQYGKHFRGAGYLLSQFKHGGFVKENNYEQALIDWSNIFYTEMQKLNKTSVRQFFTLGAKWGFSRPQGREIVANTYNGLRGLYSNGLRGDRTYTASYEVDFYAQKKVAGFTSSMFLFTDLVLVQKALPQTTFQSAVGFGFRLRNLNFGIDFIEILFAYYPKLQVPDQHPINYLGNYKNDRTPEKRDLFSSNILTVD